MKRTICILVGLALCLSAPAKDDLRLKTVVIDPGHGGHDPGAISADKKSHEKALTLDISKKLAANITAAYPDVKVVLTRTTDEYVTLDGRAVKANKVGADLFISIHINAAENRSANGFSVHVLGQSSNKNRDLFASNMDVCRRENSVIMLEDDYSTKYEGFNPSDPESYIFMVLMQNAYLEQSLSFAQMVEDKMQEGPFTRDRGISQDPFYVLWKTSMPAVLVELGFISNTSDLAALRNPDSRRDIADRLFKAFRQYKEAYDRSVSLDGEQTAAPAAGVTETAGSEQAPSDAVAEQPEEEEDTGTFYGIQIFAATKRLPDSSREFLGYTPKVIKGPTFYKYIIAVSDNVENSREKLQEIRKKYPDAFLVEVEGETITRIAK